MDKLELENTRIADLVDQNYVHAYVTFISEFVFYEYSQLTLDQVLPATRPSGRTGE